jgi:hypothetical protein
MFFKRVFKDSKDLDHATTMRIIPELGTSSDGIGIPIR